MSNSLNGFDTHRVTNQPPPLCGHDVFGSDSALREALARDGADWAIDELHELGRPAGRAATQELGRQAYANPPVLRTHDRYGHRLDVVDYHPAYHELMSNAVAHGLHTVCTRRHGQWRVTEHTSPEPPRSSPGTRSTEDTSAPSQ